MPGSKQVHTDMITNLFKNRMDINCLVFTLILCFVVTITAAAEIGGSGGEIIYEDGYTYHVFTEEDIFVPPAGIDEVEVLVVAGGGGGGGAVTGAGGGGGAGGLIQEEFVDVGGSVEITAGKGGSGGQPGERAEDGTPSAFGDLVADGGGGGGSTYNNEVAGSDGGSGGGGGSGIGGGGYTQSGDGTNGQGHDGGDGFRAGQSANRAGGGGGGAGESGEQAQNRNAGFGGDGTYLDQFLDFGANGYFAGGGGGGGSTAGSGGEGGGGSGQAETCGSGFDAQPETGGGGGGAFCLGEIEAGFAGGDGADGIVIVRYETVPIVEVKGDVCFQVGSGDFGSVLTDETSHISWLATEDNKITVEIAAGELPEGLELSVDTTRGEETVLAYTARDFITDIGEEKVIEEILTYRLQFIDKIIPSAGETYLKVKYTIIDQ